MMRLDEIAATDWQPKLGAPGEVVEALDDINQCIGIILATPKGSRAHEPLFGTDIWKYLDSPMAFAIPHIVREAVDAIQAWETRAELVRVLPVVDGAQITLKVEWKLRDDVAVQQTIEVKL